MKVAEIGCGEEPGPYYEGAQAHYLIERNKDGLAVAAQKGPYTALPESDGMHTTLPDASVDIVLARNVFGDPDLGLDSETHGMKIGFSLALIAHSGFEAYQKLAPQIYKINYGRKVAMVEEASRILIKGGRLIAVEQLTPDAADQFFAELAADVHVSHGLVFAPARISAVTPPSYAISHDLYPSDHAWVGTKPQ